MISWPGSSCKRGKEIDRARVVIREWLCPRDFRRRERKGYGIVEGRVEC